MKRQVLIVLVLALGGCKDHKPGEPRPDAQGSIPRPSASWLKGELADEAVATPVPGGTFTVRVPVEPLGLNRLHDQMVDGTMARYTVGPIYETLARFDPDSHPAYQLRPLLADSWAQSPDHLVLTVKLRKGVKFHNGDRFTSRDVKAVFDAVLEPKNFTTSARSDFIDLASVTTPDELTVVLTWKKPYFLANANALTLPILPASELKGDFNTLPINRAPIGTGPFRFVNWETGKSITLERNEEYWGPRAVLDKVVIRFVKDETVATQLWERGEFDLMTRIQPSVWRSIEQPTAANAWAITGYQRINFVENNYSWLSWNEERPFFADVRVRRALAMLYPAQKVAKNIDMDLELPTTCPFYRFSESCDPALTQLPYDPAAAAALLKAAGWVDSNGDGVLDQGGVPFKFTFLANPHSVKLAKLVPVLQEEFKKAGIEMDVEKVDPALYVSRLRAHDFDAASLSWSSNTPIVDAFQIFHSSQKNGGSNYCSYSSPRADALLEKIRLTFDDDQRHVLERALQRILYEEQPYTFLTNRSTLDAVKVNVRGLRPSLSWYDLGKVWLSPPGATR